MNRTDVHSCAAWLEQVQDDRIRVLLAMSGDDAEHVCSILAHDAMTSALGLDKADRDWNGRDQTRVWSVLWLAHWRIVRYQRANAAA